MSARLVLAVRSIAALAAVAAVTAFSVAVVRVNPATAALSYLVAVLVIATAWGIAEATVASIAAMLCFNFFFLPPVGTFTIADPQNWVALVAFLVTATIASQLSGRARRRTLEVLARQRDLERLYALSRALLLTEQGPSAWTAIARRIADAFDLAAVAVYDRQSDRIGFGGTTELTGIDDTMRDVARQAISLRHASGALVTAIRLGGAPVGALAIAGADLTDTVRESIANLAAIGLERARNQEAAARAEAARESGELRAAVLDALAHEFKTPLTSMKAAVGDLRPSPTIGPHDRELAEILDEDVDRLQTLVGDAVHMLRIDAGDFAVHRARHRLADIVQSTLQRFGPRLEGHRIVQHVPPSLAIDADRDLVSLALRQLVDNALKYSPPASAITIEAETNGSVTLTVRNTGSIIPEADRPHVLERFYRGSGGRHVPGTGMGLAIVSQIAHAHGGTIAVSSTGAEGTAIVLSFPRAVAAS